jgi:hypothetical protein
MTLVTKAELKAYLGIQTTAYDTPLDGVIAGAIGSVEAFIRRPIIAEARTFVIGRPPDVHVRRYGVMFVPIYPIAAPDSDTDALAITDDDAVTLIEDTDYRLDLRTGRLDHLTSAFGTWPYTITAVVGLSAHPDYTDRIEPVINAAILDLAADRWQRKSAAATSESTGGGVSTSYTGGGIPERVKDMLAPFVMARALG